MRDFNEGKIFPSEVGSWMSHLEIYMNIVKKAKESGDDFPILILEDNVDLEVNIK